MRLLHRRVLGLESSDVKLSLEQSQDYAIDGTDAHGQTALY